MNLIEMFICPVLYQKYLFWATLDQNINFFLFKMKLGALNNSHMLHSMVMLICPVLEQKKPFLSRFGLRNQKYLV